MFETVLDVKVDGMDVVSCADVPMSDVRRAYVQTCYVRRARATCDVRRATWGRARQASLKACATAVFAPRVQVSLRPGTSAGDQAARRT